MASAPCGTYAGYQRHRRAGQSACVECKAALAAYVAQYRRDNAKWQARRRSTERRALARLAKAHREEYLELLAQERTVSS
jgi:acyl-CoA reductase-like NAD-dependent aldehyde dehydrogenase